MIANYNHKTFIVQTTGCNLQHKLNMYYQLYYLLPIAVKITFVFLFTKLSTGLTEQQYSPCLATEFWRPLWCLSSTRRCSTLQKIISNLKFLICASRTFVKDDHLFTLLCNFNKTCRLAYTKSQNYSKLRFVKEFSWRHDT